jgi:hypothetical protein
MSNSTEELTEAKSTLVGVTNSITAMIDDILVAYASAQIMVGCQHETTNSVITINALKIGQGIYIWAVFGLNLALLLVFVEEAIRCKSWSGLTTFDYLDILSVIISASRGGPEVARVAGTIGQKESRSSQVTERIGRVKIHFDMKAWALTLLGAQAQLGSFTPRASGSEYR